MTVEELGGHTRQLADAVLARDYLAMLGSISTVTGAFEEFLAGFRHQMQGVTEGQPALPVALATVDLGPLELGCGQLFDSCNRALNDQHTQPQEMRADPVGFGPAEIIALITMAQKLGELIRNWKKRREQQQ